MFIGFFTAYFIILRNNNFDEKYGIFVGALLILLIGIVDDYYKSVGKEFAITPRLIIQLLAAVYFNYNLDFWSNNSYKLV